MTYTMTGSYNPEISRALMRDYGFDSAAELYLIAWRNRIALKHDPPEGTSPLYGKNANGERQMLWIRYHLLDSHRIEVELLEVRKCA